MENLSFLMYIFPPSPDLTEVLGNENTIRDFFAETVLRNPEPIDDEIEEMTMKRPIAPHTIHDEPSTLKRSKKSDQEDQQEGGRRLKKWQTKYKRRKSKTSHKRRKHTRKDR